MGTLARIRRRAAGLLCTALLAVCLLSAAGGTAHAGKKQPKLFNTIEFKGTIKKLPMWTRVLGQMRTWKGYFKGTATKGLPSRKGWLRLKQQLAGKSDMEKLKGVNRFFNKWPYRLDRANYGRRDYWATPAEFLKKSGDCEDYSIAKYYALKELGFKTSQLRIVAVKDMIRNIGHAVLVVYLDDDVYVLDNQTVMVLPHTRYTHYLPQYSVNEKYRWMHVPAKARVKKKKSVKPKTGSLVVKDPTKPNQME